MMKIELSKKQQEIVEKVEGAFLVTASAGSGKTRLLTERIKRLSEVSRTRILAITFTNKAATELKERLGTSEQIKKKVFVGTFHGFCQSILEKRFKKLGYQRMPHIFEDDSDRLELIQDAINSVPYFKKKYNGTDPKKRHSYKYKILQFISTVKRDLISPKDLIENSKDEEYFSLFNTYQDLLRSNNAIDFDDIIRLVYELFVNNEPVANLYRSSYQYVCVDECQDLNKIQYYFLKVFCGDTISNIMMVGDSNQSIYGFNGSSASFMEQDFLTDFNATKIQLDENYRCSKRVIEASNTLMDLDVEPANYVIDGRFEIHPLKDEVTEAEYVIKTILDLIELNTHPDIEGEISYGSFSILARNKYVFKHVEEKLKSNDIPFFYKSGNQAIKFSSPQMKILDLMLRVKLNPLDKLHLKRLESLIDVEDINDSERLANSKYPIASTIFSLLDNASVDNFYHTIKERLFEAFKEQIEDENERELALNELEEFKDQFVTYRSKNKNPTLNGFKSAMALGVVNKRQDEKGVCLSTVHTMKGQESDIVFLIGMDDGTFPDYRANNNTRLQEEKNNAYVAFTRAKRFLYVTYPKERTTPWGAVKKKSISQFLAPLIKTNI